MGFSNPIIGGGGSLVYPSIHSPDYVPAAAGWTVNKNGSAEFNNLTIRGNFVGPEFFVSNGDGTLSTTPAILFYSAAPASGNLVLSVASVAGSDKFGNVYKADVATYGGSGTSIQLDSGSPAAVRIGTGDAAESEAGLLTSLINGAGATRTISAKWQAPRITGEAATRTAFVEMDSPSEDLTTTPDPLITISAINASDTMDVFVSPVLFEVDGAPGTFLHCDTATQIVAGVPIKAATTSGGVTAESWHPMTLANSWANAAGNVTAQYRKVASPPNCVEIIGCLAAVAATSTTFFTLPAGYRPASQQQIPCGATGGAGANTVTFVQCTTGGVLSIQHGTIGAGDTYVFHGLISLDA